MSAKKRLWNKGELTIAYYIAKWGYGGLRGHTEEQMVDYVIGNTTVNSLNMQTACFRLLLGIEGYQLEHSSQKMRDLVDELQNKTIVQVRRLIFDYIDKQDGKKKIEAIHSSNKKISKNTKALNEQLQLNFEATLAEKSRGRNLVRKY